MFKVEVSAGLSNVAETVMPALRNCGVRGDLKYSPSSNVFRLSSKSSGLNLSTLTEELSLLNWSTYGDRLNIWFSEDYAEDVVPKSLLSLLDGQSSYVGKLLYGVGYYTGNRIDTTLQVSVSFPTTLLEGPVRLLNWDVVPERTSSLEAKVAFGIPDDFSDTVDWFCKHLGCKRVGVKSVVLSSPPDASVFCLAEVCGIRLISGNMKSSDPDVSWVDVVMLPYSSSVVFTANFNC